MRRIKRMGTAVAVLAATLMVATANPAQATPVHSNPEPADVVTSAELQEDAEAFADAIITLEPSIERAEDGTLWIDTTAEEAGVSQRTFDQVSASLGTLNSAVLRGELTTTADLVVQPAGPVTMHNGVIYRWWGIEVHFTNSTTNGIIGIMSAGGGVAALIGIITAATGVGAIAAGTAAALLAIGVGALVFCNRNGTGVKVYNAYVGPPWCTAH